MKYAFVILIATVIFAVIIGVFGIMLGGRSVVNGTNAGILVTADNGATWNFLKDSFKFEVTVLKMDNDGKRLLVGTKHQGLWINKPANGVWERLGSEKLSIAQVLDAAWLPANTAGGSANSVFAAVFNDQRGRVMRFNGSLETELYFTPLAQYAIFGIAIHPLYSNILWIASSDGGFYESLDGGNAWQAVYRFKEGLLRLVGNPVIPGNLWVVTSKGNLYITYDAGRSWRDLSGGLSKLYNASKIESLIFDNQSGVLYLGSNYGLSRSYDHGETWQNVPIALPPEALPVTAIATDPRNSNKIAVSVQNELFMSKDGGVNWKGIILPTKRPVSAIVIDPANSNNIYVGLKK
ncbi:MAG: hypothetical protein HZC14_03385 [Candidatus Niyogibacteria bacterium]|nr:hypothetical protein [Candidatus Niyogibacteria bacterium]